MVCYRTFTRIFAFQFFVASSSLVLYILETKEPSGLQDEVIINKPRRSESQIKKGAMYLTWKNVNVYLPAKRDFFRNKVSEKKFILEGGL